jgi:ribosomal protein L40E
MTADLLVQAQGLLAEWANVLVAWVAAGLVGGCIVGWQRNRWLAGPSAGAVLGPLGWWLVWRLPARWRECPACSARIAIDARTCRHCGADVQRASARSARSELKGRLRSDGR